MTIVLLITMTASLSYGQKWLTNVDYRTCKGPGFLIGYVNQQFNITDGLRHAYYRGMWQNDENEFLHGITLGAIVQPNLFYGLGIYTGFCMDMYVSFNDPPEVNNATTFDEAFTTYMEVSFNIPLHLGFTFPLTENFAIGFHTGPSMSLACVSMYEDSRGKYDDKSVLGEDGRMKVWNFTYDLALFLQIHKVRFDIQWSSGLNDHGLATDSSWKTYRDRFLLGTTIYFE